MGGCASRQRFSDAAERRALAKASIDVPRYEKLAGRTMARCVDVYDGDTFTVILLHQRQPVRRRCRCIGYDAPEMRGSDKVGALAAKEYLRGLIPHDTIFPLFFKGTDKYGRLLATFMVGNETLADHMIRMGHGYAYDGGTKARGPPATTRET